MASDADLATRKFAPVAAGGLPLWLKHGGVAAGFALCAFILFLLPTALGRPLAETQEARIAVVAREMLQRNDYVVPTLAGEQRLEKPPLQYWPAVSMGSMLSGSNSPDNATMAWATQIPAAIFGALAVFIVTFFGQHAFGRSGGLIAGILLALTPFVSHYVQLGYADATLMCACAGLVCSISHLLNAPKPGVFTALALGLSLGAALLVKDPIPVLVVGPALLLEVALRRSFSGRKTLLFVGGVVVALLCALPWLILLEQRVPGALQTMMTQRASYWHQGHEQEHRWIYYFHKLGAGLLPWTPLLLAAIAVFLTRVRRRDGFAPSSAAAGHFRFMLLVAVVGFLAFYANGKQQDYYLLPLMPALALTLAYIVAAFSEPGGQAEEQMGWWVLTAGGVAAVAIALLPLAPTLLQGVLRPEKHAELAAALAPVAWYIAVPLGLVVLALFFFAARSWAMGRPVVACIILGGATYLGLAAWSVHWATETRATLPIYRESHVLREQLKTYDSSVTVYGSGVPLPVLTFYLGRPVTSLRKIAAAPANAQSAPLLVATRDVLDHLKLNETLAGSDRHIVLVPLAPEDVQRLGEQMKSKGPEPVDPD